MKFHPYATIESEAEHECGELISFYVNIEGPTMDMRLTESSRFIFSVFFATTQLHFKAHGTRIKYCPKCKKLLPKTVAELGEVNR